MAEEIITVSRPNWLASEVGRRNVNCNFKQSTASAVIENGRKILKAGTVYPLNDATAKGIIFQDIDVTDGDVNGALMVAGYYYDDKLPTKVAEAAKTVFKGQGLFGEDAPKVTVPADGTLA